MRVAANSNEDVKVRPEAELLLYCVRKRLKEDQTARMKDLLRQKIDWEYLLQLALRHKVMPLLYRQFESSHWEAVPEEFAERLRDYFYMNAARNHLFTIELCEILETLGKSGIRAVPYKGAALAANIYGDITFRQFSDLDIFIHKEDVWKASELLRLRGYRREHELTSRQERAFFKIGCEHVFIHDEKGIFLELQWGFVPTYFPFKLDLEGMWRRLEPAVIADTRTRSFAPEDLLLILCVNAGKEFWKELSRLCDINELIASYPTLDWEMLTRQATLAGARRMLFISLLLAQDLLAATLPERITKSIEAERAVCPLALMVRRELFRDETARGSISNILKPAKALDSLPAQLKFHLRSALTPTLEDWAFVNLPERFGFLYYLMRPFRLAKKYALPRREESS